MRKINYQSDFDFILKLTDCCGNDVGVPEYDWVAKFYTTLQTDVFVASHKYGVYTNCFNDNGQLHIVCDNHGMSSGILRCEFIAEIPNDIYPDYHERVVSPQAIGIELVRGVGDCSCDIEAELLLPMLKGDKGDPFTFDDFTSEQLADLQKPAVEAAQRADTATLNAEKATEKANMATADAEKATQIVGKATDSANKATEDAIAATQKAEAATSQMQTLNKTVTDEEQNRVAAESLRETAEKKRDADESLRKSAEDSREEAEQGRKTAEQARKNAETSRDDAENTRIANEQTRISNENQRILDETDRQTAETARASEFTQIKADAQTVVANAENAAQSANEAAANANTVANGLEETINGKQKQLVDSPDIIVNADKLLVTERAKRALFDDMWTSLGGTKLSNGMYQINNGKELTYEEALIRYERNEFIVKFNNAAKLYGRYNEATCYFELNDITDIGYEEALTIYRDSVIYSSSVRSLYAHKYPKGRTLLPTIVFGSHDDLYGMYQYCRNLVAVRMSSGYGNIVKTNNVDGMFYACNALNEVLGILDVSQCTNVTSLRIAGSCSNIRGLYIKNLMSDFSMEKHQFWRLDCVKYIVDNAANTSAITVTVHPDVLAKLTGDTTNAAAAALSEEELAQWMALVEQAAEKNIQFASA